MFWCHHLADLVTDFSGVLTQTWHQVLLTPKRKFDTTFSKHQITDLVTGVSVTRLATWHHVFPTPNFRSGTNFWRHQNLRHKLALYILALI
jgi:hypothetical protein